MRQIEMIVCRLLKWHFNVMTFYWVDQCMKWSVAEMDDQRKWEFEDMFGFQFDQLRNWQIMLYEATNYQCTIYF